MHQQIANATFQVIAGDSRGSGFSFMKEEYVITNFHVVKNMINSQTGRPIDYIQLRTESDEILLADIVRANSDNDFAVLKLKTTLSAGREVLQPSDSFKPIRGKRLIFAGFPHGDPDLLTHEAIVSAPLETHKFYLDGMVNGGNSGGPIVDPDDGRVVGIVTKRRYPGWEAAELIAKHATELAQAIKSSHVNIGIAGLDFNGMNQMYAESLNVIVNMLNMNANSGIGLGFPIFPAVEAVEQSKRTFFTKF
ncbi:S1 family peptidase [Leclercia adecarboxylata]|uniref:S1 family peptidase n=1 Tax=Leclercia adecarboxylata TaxID=83655 RepID=UPI0013DF7AD3|nr:serine protease [Leclercia adecarboxylata]QIG28431.1 trypsin-like peptidase domain-containing protein [Leclercia adecarboxylata]